MQGRGEAIIRVASALIREGSLDGAAVRRIVYPAASSKPH
jgi:hypothetical protein